MRKPKVPKPGTIEYNTMVMNIQAEERRLEQQKSKESADKKAETDAEHRFKIKTIFLTVAATLFVEHFNEIIDFAIKLIQSLITSIS